MVRGDLSMVNKHVGRCCFLDQLRIIETARN